MRRTKDGAFSNVLAGVRELHGYTPWYFNLPDKDKSICDLVITGLVGLRPRLDKTIEVNPLVPEGALEYFGLDKVRYHGHTLTILYDKTGERYGKGPGLRILADGSELARADTLRRLTAKLP